MPKVEKDAPTTDGAQCGTTHIAARERIVPRSSAAYVYAGGKGEAAYKLIKIIEGHEKRFSERAGKNPITFKWKLIGASSGDRSQKQSGLAKQPTSSRWKVFGVAPQKKSA